MAIYIIEASNELFIKLKPIENFLGTNVIIVDDVEVIGVMVLGDNVVIPTEYMGFKVIKEIFEHPITNQIF